MTTSSSKPTFTLAAQSMYEQFSNKSYVAHARTLKRKSGSWINTQDLIAAIVANSKEPIPEVVLDHLRQRLDGTAKKRRGRKKDDVDDLIREFLVRSQYNRFLKWLQQRKKKQGLAGWPQIRNAPWWQGPPNERAARMVQANLMRGRDWRHVQNIVSKTSS